jgi:hypothetical protein
VSQHLRVIFLQANRNGPIEGCWTCRLRRKKCDERKPTCSTCDVLEITCHYHDQKPDWMDGGEREKQMADDLKSMVKIKANERRERKWALGIEPDATENASALAAAPAASSSDNDNLLSSSMANHMTLDSSPDANHSMQDSGTDRDATDAGGSSSHTPDTSVAGDSCGSFQAAPSQVGPIMLGTSPFASISNEISQSAQQGVPLIPFHTKSFPDPSTEKELNFSMMYLDYVFPYLSPFYRPPLLESGRGWLLVLLTRNKALFHTALSIASYFFAVMLDTQCGGHEECRRHNWEELQKQQELAIKALQINMACLNTHGVEGLFRESIQCLEGIYQLLSFETVIGNRGNWQVHLDVVSVLFEKVLAAHATDATRPWYSLIAHLSSIPLEVVFPGGRHPWSSEQASFRFLTVNLFWTDIIASTALEQPPRLQKFHAEVLDGVSPLLPCEEFFGCHNWVILIISQISTLDAWKKEMRRAKTLSVVELVQRASCIEARLRAGIEALDAIPMNTLNDPSARAPDQPFLGAGPEYAIEIGNIRTTPSQAFHTKIWAMSALSYLAVVVSGYQPSLPEMQANVAATMDLFRLMPSPLCLRTFVWPLTVTGCLALPDQESFFRELVGNMGSMQVFGTVKEGLSIMSEVWQHRNCVTPDTWDIATCLNVLGHPSLLI